MAREIDETWVEEAIGQYQRIHLLKAEFDKAMHGLEVTVRSKDETVEVDVTAAGEIRRVRVAAPVHSRTAQELSAAVQDAVTSAADAARWARDQLYRDTFAGYAPLVER